MVVLSQQFHDQNASIANELAGPFQNHQRLTGIQYCGPQQRWQGLKTPTVRSVSTFEEYLERTVNSIKENAQIAFHPSQVVMLLRRSTHIL